MAKAKLAVRRVSVEAIQPDGANARRHPSANLAAIRASLARFGQQRPLVVRPDGTIIAGNGTFDAALALGWTELDVVTFSGTDEEARAFAIADNRTAELAAWNQELLSEQLDELASGGWDIGELGFLDDAELRIEADSGYTRTVNVPRYEVVGEEPEVADLYDTSKTEELRFQVALVDLEPEVRAFLDAAAARHTVFDYRRIAEFYAHATPEVQRLMEESALVIIDVDDAIKRGFVRFSDALSDLIDGDDG